LSGLSGRFPDAVRIGRLELRDKDGPWLALENLALDWSPASLLSGEVAISRLEAGHIALNRLPPPSPPAAEPSGPISLPIAVRLDRLTVARLDLAEAVAGKPASLLISGKARLKSLQQGEAELRATDIGDGLAEYQVQARLDAGKVQAQLTLREPAQGLLGSLAGIQELDALAVEAAVEGPLTALQTRLQLSFGPLQAKLDGVVDSEGQTITKLKVQATAPAMRPRPDVSWQAIALDAQVQGAFTSPHGAGELRIDQLEAVGAGVRNLMFNLQGDAGKAALRGEITGLRLPGPKPDLLASAPLSLQAEAQLDAADRPVSFKLKHVLFNAEGKAATGGEPKLEMVLNLPDLKPFAALGGLDTQGKTTLNLRVVQQQDNIKLDLDGLLSVTGGAAPMPALLGDAAKLSLAAQLRGQDLSLERLQLDGKALAVSAKGTLASNIAQFDWKFALSDWAAVMAGASGRLNAAGQIQGPLDKFAVSAEVNGELATKELPRGPINAKLNLTGLPNLPVGALTARGMVAGAPLDLALAATAPPDGSLKLTIDRADWKSAHAQGALNLPKGAELPLGKVELRMGKLDDLRPLLGQPVSGTVTATLETLLRGNTPWAQIRLNLERAGITGTATVAHTGLDLSVADPVKKPVFDGQLKLNGINAGSLANAGLNLDFKGPLAALDLRLSAQVPALAESELKLDTTARLDAPALQLALSDLQAHWKGETLRLLAPARIVFKDGVAVDRLRLGLREAVLELAGQASPKLNLQARLSGVSADMAAIFVPNFAAGGHLSGEATLTGTPARPSGHVKLQAEDMQMKTGPGRGLLPLRLAAEAQLAGTSAQIDARLSAPRDLNLTVTGAAPLNPTGSFDLKLAGIVDLKLLDPLLGAAGRRVRGQLALDAALAGTLSVPQIGGTVRLEKGEVQDYAAGVHVNDIAALIALEGSKIRLDKFIGRAGPGTLSATGEVDWQADGLPTSFSLTARNARPLASDRITAELDADLALQGKLKGDLAAAGKVLLKRVEIRIPENLPASVAVLKVRRPGDAPPPPPAPASQQTIALNLTVEAPGKIFVRGRGLDAELGGTIHLRGTAAQPQPDGGFELRRGEFSLAGQTLNFTRGKVGFDGGSLADPSLDFLAQTRTRTVTAKLGVAGTASKPKITLSSIPELPQDEVLAQLLFGRAAASLSPLELAQIAGALASLTGVTSGVGNPLEAVRKTLGLDRLSVGANVEAGRYVAPGVYIGTKQAITGGGTQATAQIELMRGLKLEGAVGTGSPTTGGSGSSGASSVGVIFEHEY
jgi:translocation and assembly module TamB